MVKCNNSNLTGNYSYVIKNSIISQIVTELLKYKPDIIILHGSTIKNVKNLNSSDIDLVIVSDFFNHVIFFDRIKYIQNLLNKFKPLIIDAICLTSKEFINSIKKKKNLYYSLLKGYSILYNNQRVFFNEIF
ncbi:hypothetical protein LCGC14_0973620 [marine sediment metagenome]|uniref:Polymerase nucleotidyl transferase domain-containing protein n=1 Tax=marine sediment metagenome TaxID=412755 RepID=A0A0F9NFB9_9ZZZZ